MKRQIVIALLGISFLVLSSVAQDRVIIDPEIRRQISDIVDRPVEVFQLDHKENLRIFNHMDEWFNQHINFKKAILKQNEEKDSVSYKLQLSKNLPISPTQEKVKGVITEKPFNVWYFKEPQKRSFIKELRIPTKQSLPDERLIELGKNFITINGLCKITDNDKWGEPLVTSRKRHELKLDVTESDKLIILQRVEFGREFSGFEVINSKQIVDIHPDSREVISYKSIMWTPVDETSGKRMPYVSKERVMAKIDSAFSNPNTEYEVKKVKAGMFQTDKIIFPVLVVYTKQQLDESEAIPIERVLVINLVRDLDLEKPSKKVKRPTRAK